MLFKGHKGGMERLKRVYWYVFVAIYKWKNKKLDRKKKKKGVDIPQRNARERPNCNFYRR
jgi:hypothetical protein